MKRKIIEIDEENCNGCGACVTGCAEGALAIVNGKAKLVNDVFCDGLGACIGECPTGALKIIEREAPEFDEAAVQKHVQKKMPPAGGCPGLQIRFGQQKAESKSVAPTVSGQVIPSELNQWPTQLHLVPPVAPFFKNRELVVLSTCSPSASPDVNWRFIRGRAIVIACPKLDRTEGYVEKLTNILKSNGIPKVIIVRMEVPCCGGLTMMVKEAARQSGRDDLIVEEAVIGLDGELREIKRWGCEMDELKGKALNLKTLVDYSAGAVVSRTLLKKATGNITLFSFDKGQGLSEHTSPFDAVVEVVEGKGTFIIAGEPKTVSAGEMIIMPANVPHDVQAAEAPFKMLLIMIRSES